MSDLSGPRVQRRHTEHLAGAIASAVAPPLVEAVREAVRGQLTEATQQIIDAVRDAVATVPGSVQESWLFAGGSASDSSSQNKRPLKHLPFKSCSSESRSGTLCNPDKDVRALAAGLADVTLKDAGLSQGTTWPGGKKRGNRHDLGPNADPGLWGLPLQVEEADNQHAASLAPMSAERSHASPTPDLVSATGFCRQALRQRDQQGHVHCDWMHDEQSRGPQLMVCVPDGALRASTPPEFSAQSGFKVRPGAATGGSNLSINWDSELPVEATFRRSDTLEVEKDSTDKVNTRCLTTEEMLQVRVAELTESIHFRTQRGSPKAHAVGSCGLHDPCGGPHCSKSVPLVFRLWGILPWGRIGHPRRVLWYQCAVFAFLLLATVGLVMEAVAVHQEGIGSVAPTCDVASHNCWHQRGLLSDLPLAIGAVFGLLLLGTLQGGKDLDDMIAVLQAYACQQDLKEKWMSQSRRDAGLILLLWLLANAAVVLGTWHDATWSNPSWRAYLHVLAFVVTSSTLMCLTFCMLYVCRALTVMVDFFCCWVVDHPDIAEAIHDWNVLQALLRKASITIELSFVALQIGAAFAVPMFILDFAAMGSHSAASAVPTMLPGVLLATGILRTFFLAASITDKCVRIPSLINSLSFGDGTDRVKQHMVEYILNSAAGFYVCDVRLTVAIAVRFLYMWFVVAFGLGTKVLSQG